MLPKIIGLWCSARWGDDPDAALVARLFDEQAHVQGLLAKDKRFTLRPVVHSVRWVAEHLFGKGVWLEPGHEHRPLAYGLWPRVAEHYRRDFVTASWALRHLDEALRQQIHPDVWINRALHGGKTRQHCLIPDLCHRNEAQAVRAADGIVVRAVLTAPSVALPDVADDCDFVLRPGPIDQLTDQVGAILENLAATWRPSEDALADLPQNVPKGARHARNKCLQKTAERRAARQAAVGAKAGDVRPSGRWRHRAGHRWHLQVYDRLVCQPVAAGCGRDVGGWLDEDPPASASLCKECVRYSPNYEILNPPGEGASDVAA